MSRKAVKIFELPLALGETQKFITDNLMKQLRLEAAERNTTVGGIKGTVMLTLEVIPADQPIPIDVEWTATLTAPQLEEIVERAILTALGRYMSPKIPPPVPALDDVPRFRAEGYEHRKAREEADAAYQASMQKSGQDELKSFVQNNLRGLPIDPADSDPTDYDAYADDDYGG